MTSCNSQRKGKTTEGKKTGKSLIRYEETTYKTSRTDRIKIYNNYIRKGANWPVKWKKERPSKLVVTIAQIIGIFSIKILEI